MYHEANAAAPLVTNFCTLSHMLLDVNKCRDYQLDNRFFIVRIRNLVNLMYSVLLMLVDLIFQLFLPLEVLYHFYNLFVVSGCFRQYG